MIRAVLASCDDDGVKGVPPIAIRGDGCGNTSWLINLSPLRHRRFSHAKQLSEIAEAHACEAGSSVARSAGQVARHRSILGFKNETLGHPRRPVVWWSPGDRPPPSLPILESANSSSATLGSRISGDLIVGHAILG
jgi:hypothetical protein